MILKHPLNPENEANKIAIEKYKDRPVYIEHGLNNLWMGHNGWVGNKVEAEKMTFKEALKKTKNYKAASMIRYHFLSPNDDMQAAAVSEFALEDIYSCTTIKFEEPNERKYKSKS